MFPSTLVKFPSTPRFFSIDPSKISIHPSLFFSSTLVKFPSMQESETAYLLGSRRSRAAVCRWTLGFFTPPSSRIHWSLWRNMHLIPVALHGCGGTSAYVGLLRFEPSGCLPIPTALKLRAWISCQQLVIKEQERTEKSRKNSSFFEVHAISNQNNVPKWILNL